MTEDEVVDLHFASMARQDHLVLWAGDVHHPHSPKLKIFALLLRVVIKVLPKLIKMFRAVCGRNVAAISSCLAAMNLPTVDDSLPVLSTVSIGKPFAPHEVLV